MAALVRFCIDIVFIGDLILVLNPFGHRKTGAAIEFLKFTKFQK